MFMYASTLLVGTLAVTSVLPLTAGPTAPTANVRLDISTTAEGSIKSVDPSKKSFTLHAKDGDMEIQVTDSTAYTLDGKASTFQDAVKAGRTAVVNHTNKTASKVDVTSS